MRAECKAKVMVVREIFASFRPLGSRRRPEACIDGLPDRRKPFAGAESPRV